MLWPFIHKTPPRRQIDPIECGAVCLGIILESFGVFINNRDLRKACKTSRSGSAAASLIDGARQFCLTGTAHRCLASDLKKSTGPSILFFDECHFVVFEGYFLGQYYINDPARGRYRLDAETFRKRFSKIVITFKKTEDFIVGDESKTDEYLPSDKLPKIWWMSLGIFSGVIFASMAATIGLLLSGNSRSLTLDKSFIIGGLLLFLMWLMFAFLIFWRSIKQLSIFISQHEIASLKTGIALVPYSFFDDFPFTSVGRTFSSVPKRSLLYSWQMANKYFFQAFIIVIFIAVMAISPWVSIAILLSSLLYLSQAWFRTIGSNTIVDFQNNEGLAIAIRQASDMRAMGQSPLLLKGLLVKEIQSFNWRGESSLLFDVVPLAIFSWLFCLIVQNSWRRGDIALSEIFAMFILCFSYAASLRVLVSPKSLSGQDESAWLRRELQSQAESMITLAKPLADPALIHLKNIDFSYRGENTAIWQGIDLEIGPEEIIGLVGAPLSGKSTLMALLGAKIWPSSGTIIHFSRDLVPLRIANIDDDADLMEASLKDNITLFDHKISEDMILKALTSACATEIFYNRPMGLLTPIFAHGSNLSVSEKKRLLLAQALAHKPDLILLDDFFMSLDEKIACEILLNLKACKITTVFTSLHMPTLAMAQRIIVIENHHSLISKSPEQWRGIKLFEDLVL